MFLCQPLGGTIPLVTRVPMVAARGEYGWLLPSPFNVVVLACYENEMNTFLLRWV